MIEIFLTLLGLIVFEVVSGVDNAIVNASILRKMSEKWRRRFLTIGILISVFSVRFLIPLFMLALTINNFNIYNILTKEIFTEESIKKSEQLILMFGGIFLIYVYLHWLFIEEKEALFLERFIKKEHRVWFFAACSAILTFALYISMKNPYQMLSASLAATIFFILYGLREIGEMEFKKIIRKNNKDVSLFLYLLVIDASFSIDQVIGAFAFTRNLLIIVLAATIGALIVRYYTIKGIGIIKKYELLKNGAMTSIGIIGFMLILESIGIKLPIVLPPILIFIFVGISFYYAVAKKRK